jgi:hypothetical protein
MCGLAPGFPLVTRCELRGFGGLDGATIPASANLPEFSATAVHFDPVRSTTKRVVGLANEMTADRRTIDMKYVCLGFIDEAKFAAVPPAEGQKMREACFAYDDELRRGGHFLGGEALDSALKAVSLKMKDGAVEVTDGPFAETKETLGGILLLEARDLNHAIALMSKHPGVKMGPCEIRPANEPINQLIAERNAAFTRQS